MGDKAARSQGAVLLARVGATQDEIAARAGMSRVRVSHFQNGIRRPGPANRALFKRLYGIPEAAWDVPPASLEPPAVEPVKSGERWTLMSRVERLQSIVDRTLGHLATDGGATPAELTRVGRQLGQMMNEIGKLTGETTEIDEARILKLPAFRRVMTRICDALYDHPEASDAVARALEELGR